MQPDIEKKGKQNPRSKNVRGIRSETKTTYASLSAPFLCDPFPTYQADQARHPKQREERN
jgi:hypothetical protein